MLGRTSGICSRSKPRADTFSRPNRRGITDPGRFVFPTARRRFGVVGPPTSGMIIDGPIHAQERISQVIFIHGQVCRRALRYGMTAISSLSR
jgi:hypothetical protein